MGESEETTLGVSRGPEGGGVGGGRQWAVSALTGLREGDLRALLWLQGQQRVMRSRWMRRDKIESL